jgi:hypothetical protein
MLIRVTNATVDGAVRQEVHVDAGKPAPALQNPTATGHRK